jgi:hypothetical protein
MSQSHDKVCVVLLCNSRFFSRMLGTLNSIRGRGYEGDVCVVIGDDLKESYALNHPLLKDSRTQIKHFPDIEFDEVFMKFFETIDRPEHWREKIFQYHKLHLFNACFKQWDYIFYVDSGAFVFSDIKPILESRKQGKFLAHSDAYHTYEWKLRNQFDQNTDLFKDLNEAFDLGVDYPQTTIMLYDTSLIDDRTYDELLELAKKWSISITNDQGVIALYFTNVKKAWEQITLENESTWYYDYLLRDHKRNKPHIILKRY